ncbi:thrB [Symbiodinium microadriaticum]|nr:thrB [Symbiodinium microadriaticum]
MAIEAKADVVVDNLSNDEVLELLRGFGAEPLGEPVRLFGGYASSNFKVMAKVDGGESKAYLLKVNYYGLNLEDIEHQLFVMNHLRTSSFPTNYPYPSKSGTFYEVKGGRTAILLDFITGKRGDEMLASDEGKTEKLLKELAAALAQLHQVSWPSDKKLRDIRAGYPLCNTGDLLRGEELEALKANERFKDHPYVAFVDKQTPWLRATYASEVPWGLIHGDAFLDNTLYEEGPPGSGDCKLLALVDWEPMESRKDGELLLPAAAVAGRTWQRPWVPGFLLRMPVLDAANTSPLIEELGGEVVRNLYRRPAPGIWKSAPRNFWPFAVFCMFMSGLCVPPFARIAKFQKDGALFFSFALQLTVVIMYLPRLGVILRTRRGPWQTYLLLGAFWCCSVLLKSRAYERLPIAFCFLVSNIRMPLGLVLRVCFCGKQYTLVQYLGASMIASSILVVCVKSALTADMEVLVDGLCRLLTATLLQTVELRLMRNFIQRYGGSIQEYTLFTHLFALTILFPPFWRSISHHIHICLSAKDHWLSSRLASGVVLHFFARGLASALASRSPTVQLAQVVQGFAGMCQVFVALWCSESTPDASLYIMAAVAVAIGNLLYLSNVENAEENCSSPALGKMLEMESPALKQVWAEATLEAKQGNEEAIRRENLAWRRIGLQG